MLFLQKKNFPHTRKHTQAHTLSSALTYALKNREKQNKQTSDQEKLWIRVHIHILQYSYSLTEQAGPIL